MGTTSTFLKSRVSKPTLGKWSSGFTAVKKYAESNNVPLIAVWSNGDACGHCVNFEKSISQSDFTKWMASSGCVFWFGCSSDKSKDDKFEGTGFMWARGGKLSGFPFCRVYWKSGKIDTYKSGSDWTGGTAKGGATFVKKLKDLLKNFKPGSTTPTTTPTAPTENEPTTPPPSATEPTCENGNCGTCDCDALKKQVAELTSNVNELTETVQALTAKVNSLTTENNNLKKTITNVQSKWVTVLKNIESLDAEIKAL